MEFNMSDYLSSFIDELNEQLQLLDVEILNLEKEPNSIETIQNIFRAAHTLKGSSAAMGFEQLKEVTHHLENVFEKIRMQHLTVTAALITVIFDTIDYIRLLKDKIIDGSINEVDISAVVKMLSQFIDEPLVQTGMLLEPVDENLMLDDYQLNILKKGIEFGYKAWKINVVLNEQAQMKNVRAVLITNKLRTLGELVVTSPSAEIIENEKEFEGTMSLIILSHFELEDIEQEFNTISNLAYVSITPFENLEQTSILKPIEPQNNKLEQIENKEDSPEEKRNTALKKTTEKKLTNTVRVDVEKLEQLMNLVGELVIDQTRLVDVRGKFSEMMLANVQEFEVLDEVTNHLSRVITELQAGMMKTRMLPIEQLFNRFPRMVRDTALKADKEIEFVIEGEETELDRTLVEEIIDPIIHLLRNAVDHGIETKEQRLNKAKSPKGLVKLTASHEENHVVIKVIDDGRGIDPEKIKKAAVNKNIISEEEVNKLSDRDALFLIFHSGFSTAKAVTDISGRGVGMDIVKSHIEKLNGIIDIDSVIGQGTTFTIKLPLTLAIIPSLLVKFGPKTFAIPLANVLEIIRINKEDIQTINNQEYGMIRGRVLPLVRMKEKLGIVDEYQETLRQREFVVVVGIADKRIGIIADKTIGNQEVVIKSLGSYIGTPAFISGGTIMGDGSVALILDVSTVIRNYGAQVQEQNTVISKQNVQSERQIVTFKIDREEYGVEITQAKDIITVPSITKIVQTSEEVLGLINLRGNILPVIDLRSRFGLSKATRTHKSRVIVIENGDKDVAVIVDEVMQVINIKEETIEPLNESHLYTASKWIKGVSKLADRVVLLLDIKEVLSTIVKDEMYIELTSKSPEEEFKSVL